MINRTARKVNSRFDSFTEKRELPTLAEMIPKRSARCIVKIDLLIVRAGIEAMTSPDGLAASAPMPIVGLEGYERDGYHGVFGRALGRGAIAADHQETVRAYIDGEL